MDTKNDLKDKAGNFTLEKAKTLYSKNRRKRHNVNNNVPSDVAADEIQTTTSTSIAASATPTNNNKLEIYDGPLDPNSNYSGFIEVIGKPAYLKMSKTKF